MSKKTSKSKHRTRLSRSEHLSKSVLLEETGSSGIMRLAIVFMALLLIAFLAWANYTSLAEVAVAEGRVIPTSQVRKIQHPTGGVVSEIAIEEGMLVYEGQTLIWLMPTDDEAQLSIKELQKNALQARKERLDHFVSQINGNIKNLDLRDIRLTAYHHEILESLRDFEKIEGEILGSQIEALKNELGVLAREEERLVERKALLDRELEARNILVLKGEVTRVSLLNLDRELNDVENELSQIPLQCFRLLVDHQKNSLSELSRIDNELAQIEKQIERYRNSLRHSRISAPVDGIVHNLSIRSAGEVIASGVTIFEIVPREKELIAEIQITPKDIGHVALNQPAKLKFATYDVSSYGSLDGTISRISATTFLDAKGQPYYRAVVKLSRDYMGSNPEQNLIMPGMTLEADIQTGSKTVMQYLLKPVFKSGRQALRER
jgi:membrane fusion protein, adhesin transport system